MFVLTSRKNAADIDDVNAQRAKVSLPSFSGSPLSADTTVVGRDQAEYHRSCGKAIRRLLTRERVGGAIQS